MPFIVMKRDDIPAGLLQITDLKPNTSQRNYVVEPPGQTGYKRAPTDTSPVLQTSGGVITFTNAAEGLAAWFLTNVDDGTGAAATGTITTVAKASLLDNETFTISDGTTSTVFAFHVTGGYAPVVGEVAVDVTAAVTASNVRDAMISAINGVVGFDVTASINAAAVLDLVNDANGTAGNVVITDTVADVGFTSTGMAGGVDGDALTAAEAIQNAQDVFDLVGFANNAVTAGAVDIAAVNGALTTGSITAAQLTEVLQILAGAEYLVAAGTQIEAASAFNVSGTYGMTPSTLRNTYDGVYLRMSFTEGVISKFVSADFTYLGVAGAALVVYDDLGALYTI